MRLRYQAHWRAIGRDGRFYSVSEAVESRLAQMVGQHEPLGAAERANARADALENMLGRLVETLQKSGALSESGVLELLESFEVDQ